VDKNDVQLQTPYQNLWKKKDKTTQPQITPCDLNRSMPFEVIKHCT